MATITQSIGELSSYLNSNITLQGAVVLFSVAISLFLSSVVKKSYHPKSGQIQKFLDSVYPFFFFSIIFLGISIPFFHFSLSLPTKILSATLLLFLTLTASSTCNKFIKNPFLKFSAQIVNWTILLFYNIGIIPPLVHYLSHASLRLGHNSVTFLTILKALFVTVSFGWAANTFSNYIDRRVKLQKHLHSSFRLLISKSTKTLLLTFSIFLGLSLFGVDLKALSFLAGAAGVGIAFGLQNILSNFFCGFIILFDKSVKPGDIICIRSGDTYGIVLDLHARYVSVRTREGKKHLIPNQLIVSEKLENWSFNDSTIRMEIPFRVSYDSDLILLEKILVEIAETTTRVLNNPSPSVRFTSLIDNAVELKLYYWVADPDKGVNEIRSEMIKRIWKAFRENNIKIPYPPREVFHRSDEKTPLSSLLNSTTK